MSHPQYGDPFLLSVWEGQLSGKIDTADLDGIFGVEHEPELVREVTGSVQHYGGGRQVYLCIPIARASTDDKGDPEDGTNAPGRVVTTTVSDHFVRVAQLAAAGVTK